MTSDFAKETSEGGSDTSPVQMLAESLSAIVETLNSASKGKSTGKGKTTACGGQPLAVDAVLSKQEGPVKNRRGKSRAKAGSGGTAKGKGERAHMLRVRREWAPARLCPSEGCVNDLEQVALEGEDTNDDGCWTEEDDDTLQLLPLQRVLSDELSTRTA